ncbi:MAG: acyltransferase [Bacteroidota bacterium]
MNKIYFRGLNGIRAIAALIVIVFHIDQSMDYLFGIQPVGFYLKGTAHLGVILFFSLSGFLITYLLLKEKEQFGTIDLPKFYKRRILRIWPLYYLIIIIGIIFIFLKISIPPEKDFITTITLYTFLMANAAYAFEYAVITLIPLWSVGVEEQFYVFWPILINKTRNTLRTLALVIFFYISAKLLFRFLENGNWYKLISLTAFDTMAIGGIAAFLYYSQSKWLRLIYHPAVQITSWLALAYSIFYTPLHILYVLDNELCAIFFTIIIVNVSTNPKTILDLEKPVFNFIGRISYGMYVYHIPLMFAFSYFFKRYLMMINNYWLEYFFIYFIIITTTILISWLSFQYFEKYFLKQKSRFSKIHSTN